VIAGRFEREYGCTETEWLRWLPGAVREHGLSLGHAGQAHIAIGGGELRLGWTVLPPREIAMIRMPRMSVTFAFEAVSDEARAGFMRYFDLYLQRGGG
jgi:hypothetical protein